MPTPDLNLLRIFDVLLEERSVTKAGVRLGLSQSAVSHALNRFALAKVDPADSSIQVHRLVQAAVRSEMSQDDQQDTMHEVHRILAEARPPEDAINDPANWPGFELIWPHLAPSQAEECREE